MGWALIGLLITIGLGFLAGVAQVLLRKGLTWLLYDRVDPEQLRARFHALAEALGSRCDSHTASLQASLAELGQQGVLCHCDVRRDGRRFELYLHFHRDKARVSATLKLEAAHGPPAREERRLLEVDSFPRIHLYSESGYRRLAKATGMNREVSLGDPAFDAAVYVESDNSDETIREVLSDPGLREAALALIEAELSVELGLSPKVSVSDPKPEQLDHDWVAGVLDVLGRVEAGLPRVAWDPATKQPARVGFMTALVAGWIALAPALIAIPFTTFPFERMPLFLTGGGVCLGTLLVWALVVRGRSDSCGTWLSGALLVGMMVPFAAVILLAFLNTQLDTSWGDEHSTVVVEVVEESEATVVYVEPWSPDEDEPVRIQDPEGVPAQALTPGARVVVVTRAGAFGWLWCEELKVAPPR